MHLLLVSTLTSQIPRPIHFYFRLYMNNVLHQMTCLTWRYRRYKLHCIFWNMTFDWIVWKVWANKTSVTPSLFIEVPVPNQQSERSYIMCYWYRFCLFLRFSLGFWNCSDSVVFVCFSRFWNCSDSVVFLVFHFNRRKKEIPEYRKKNKIENI